MAEYLYISANIVRFHTIQIKKNQNVKNRKEMKNKYFYKEIQTQKHSFDPSFLGVKWVIDFGKNF